MINQQNRTVFNNCCPVHFYTQMKNILISLLMLFLQNCNIVAMPAYPYKIAVMVNGQTKYIHLFGDEKYKRAESENGYTIIQNTEQQWCYAKLRNDSTLEASQWLLGTEDAENKDFNTFINTTPKHLAAIQKQTGNATIYRSGQNKKVVGQRRILVILMEYKDLSFSKSSTDFYRLFNEEGYNDDNAQGSVKDFYSSASYNQLNLESDIYGPYISMHEMSYYGQNTQSNGNDKNAYALFEEAITNVAKDTDLEQYDGDGDGIIDNVHIIFAGYGEEAGAPSDAIWSHEATFYQPYEINGLKIDRYSCAPELRGNSGNGISRIGPHCHEIGHALGAMDYYDTDYSTGGEYAGTGQWDVMASGSWNDEGITPADFNPYVKAYNFGWISPKSLPHGEVSIEPSCNDAENYYILRSSEDGDYYLLENRSKDKWGVGVPGEGLLIFHIHSDISNAGNKINTTAPQKCYVVCASSRSESPDKTPASYGEINSAGCPYPGISANNNFGQNSIPKAFFWNGEACGIEINDITKASDGWIHLTNNSIGADFESVDMKRLFFEGFENECMVNIIESTDVTWQIEENQTNTMAIIDKPAAYEGIRSLHLSAKNLSNDVSGALEFNCMPLNTTGKLRIKVHYTSMFLRFNFHNILKIGYRMIGNSNWQFAEIISTENNIWRQAHINLPSDIQMQFRIEGFSFAGSILAIDNIEVEQEELVNEPQYLKIISSDKENKKDIYTLDGIKRKNCIKGLNILKYPDGSCKKIYKR